ASRQELRNLLVLERQEPWERLDDGHLDTVRGEDVRKLDPHRAGPDHHHRRRQAVEPERLIRADDAALVDRHPRQALRPPPPPASSVRVPPSGAVTRTAPGAVRVPRPGTRVILFFRNRNSTPFDIRSATCRLRV